MNLFMILVAEYVILIFGIDESRDTQDLSLMTALKEETLLWLLNTILANCCFLGIPIYRKRSNKVDCLWKHNSHIKNLTSN